MSLLDDFDFDALAAPVVTADPEDFKEGMRQLAAGVTIVTTAVGERRNGLTATAVCSLSAEPPMLLACVNREAGAHDPTLLSRGLLHQRPGRTAPRPGCAVRVLDAGGPSAFPPETGVRSRPVRRS